ncbi:MAG: hypothetical protein ABIH79_01160 [archaeon]
MFTKEGGKKMCHSDKVIKLKITELVERLKDYKVENFCKAVFEIAEEFQRKYISRDDVQHVSSIIGVAAQLRDRTEGLKIEQLAPEEYDFKDILWLINFLIIQRKVNHPVEMVTYTTLEELEKKIRVIERR